MFGMATREKANKINTIQAMRRSSRRSSFRRQDSRRSLEKKKKRKSGTPLKMTATSPDNWLRWKRTATRLITASPLTDNARRTTTLPDVPRPKTVAATETNDLQSPMSNVSLHA
uniref:Uncharacterized protein n=1 Tax=Plectus sambesii TaxID=2011161 RepID=A0A914V5C5_9BILA